MPITIDCSRAMIEPGDVLVVERGQAPARAARRPRRSRRGRPARTRAGCRGSRRGSSSTPCRAPGRGRRGAAASGSGESRCHQYRRPAAAKLRCSSTWMKRVLERGVVERRDVPDPHRADVGDDAERRVRRTGPAARSIHWMRRVAGRRMCLVSAERQADRREVGDQQVLDHVHRRELLAEPVDRRDQREEQAARRRCTRATSLPTGRRARAALGARDAPAPDVDPDVGRQREQHDRAQMSSPASTGTAVPSRIVANTAQDCDDRVLIRCGPLRDDAGA